MMDFLVKHKLINNFSEWVPKSKIIPNKFVMFFEEIAKWVDEGSPVDVIYLDFQKAFDKSSASKNNTQVKITWYGKQYNQLDRAMAN